MHLQIEIYLVWAVADIFFIKFLKNLLFIPHGMQDLSSPTRIEPLLNPALAAQSLNYWTNREVPNSYLF